MTRHLSQSGEFGELHCKLRHAVPIEPGLRSLSPENGIFQMSAGDYRRLRSRSGQFRSPETDSQFAKARHWRALLRLLGACPNSRCSTLSESDSTLGYEQVFSPLEYRSDAAAA